MSFPNDHRWPSECPTFKVDGHAFADIGVAEDVPFERGEDRSRQIYSFNPQLVRVATRLTQTQFNRLHAWYEDELLAGAARFDVQVAEQGGSAGAFTAWWEAQFVGVYRADAKRGGLYEVTAELLLLDGPYATRTAPGLRGAASSTSVLVAAPVIDGALRGSMTSSSTLQGQLTQPVLRGSMTSTSTLTGYATELDLRLVEDGQARLNELGEQRSEE